GLLVNGVTAALSPLAVAPDFVRRLTQDALKAQEALDGETEAEQTSLAELRRQIEQMGTSLLGLTGLKTIGAERVQALVAELTDAYHKFRRGFVALEERCTITQRFYETRPADSAQRIDELVKDLPRLFAEQMAAA